MQLKIIEEYIYSLFETNSNPEFASESGVTVRANEDIKCIGYCTNLTLDTIEEAKNNKVDLLITHHDAWESLYGLRDACQERLLEYNISHYYNHIPLDDCSFGTNNSLIDRLGLNIIEKSHEYNEFYCGRITEPTSEVSFQELVKKLELILDEPVRAWQFNNNKIKRIGIVCGGGGTTTDIKEAVEKNCDVYITGEKSLYTIEYAKYTGINLIIGSHTFTELFGVESLANMIKTKYESIEIIRIDEEHLEAK